jgi:hypothetical protein
MSRAFVKEDDEVADVVPERPISAHPNLVTAEGLSLIDGHLISSAAQYEATRKSGNRSKRARAARELRYWTSRHMSAQVVAKPAATDNGEPLFFGETAAAVFEKTPTSVVLVAT